MLGCPWWQLDTYHLEGTWVVTRSLQTDKHKRRNTTDKRQGGESWRSRVTTTMEHWKKFYSNIINFNFSKYKLTSNKGTPESKDLVTIHSTPGSKDQVATKGTRALRRRIFSDIYGCPSYQKTAESYYNLRQLGITNCVDRQLLQNAATLITQNA